jgi:hypothetical protein
MLVNWKGEGMNMVPPIDPEEKDAAKANLIKQVMLYPGWNEVPDNLWAFCKIHLRNYVEREMIEEISTKTKDEQGLEIYVGVPFVDIAARNPNKAAVIVQNCYNIPCLKNWLEGTGKDEIRALIRSQVEKCENGGELST